MKLQFLVLIFVLLFASFALAGNIHTIDFSEQEEKTIELALGDGAEFEPMKGVLILKNIKDDGGVDMKLVLSDGRVWGLIPLKKLSNYNVDIDRDNDNDLAVLLRETSDDIATISFKEIKDDIEQTNSGNEGTVEETDDGGSKVTGRAVSGGGGSKLVGVLIVIGIVVAGVLIYFFFVKKSRKY